MKKLIPTPERAERDLSPEAAELESRLEGYKPPAAFAVGLATIGPGSKVLDVRFPVVNFEQNWGSAAVLAHVTGYREGTATYDLSRQDLQDAIDTISALVADNQEAAHNNFRAWKALLRLSQSPALGGQRQLVAAFIDNRYETPLDAVDAYLRLHLLSNRKVLPNSINLAGIFPILNTAVWTNHGPFDPEDFALRSLELEADGHDVIVHLVDKFPRMVDYVVPTGVRIANGNRVRLGAHLAEGTVVMHEGFCNFNAGTLGNAMIEGRISQGVIIGNNSDVGGGASIMGTLSGGGTETISMGENCLLGANAGLGISLGNDCIIESGLYLTSGTKVSFPDGEIAKARDLNGCDGLLFRRHSQTGAVQAIPLKDKGWVGLNPELHD